jgi:F420H(2)-dependent quinone reductase
MLQSLNIQARRLLMPGIYRVIIRAIVFIYRITKGGLGGRMTELDVLLLTTTGRKSGKRRTTPLGYFEDSGGYVVIGIGSNAGFATHPAWFHNLRSNPQVHIEIKDCKLDANAEIVDAGRRRALWARLVAISPQYERYEKKTTREIPLVLLHPNQA